MSDPIDAKEQLRRRLRQADPPLADSGMSAQRARSMRRRVLAEAESSRSPGLAWAGWIPAAAGMLLLLFLVNEWSGGPPDPVAQAPQPGIASPRERQIHFSTPGGTRVIWVLDPEFKV